ncbi:MAG: hypothetical protein Q7S28_04410 [bacterium]|nr:hypothetical protein [bacterium]
MFGFTQSELNVLRRLSTPAKIQDFLNALPFNKEKGGETCMSPRRVLRARRAHCLEGAMLAAAALGLHEKPMLLLDLRSAAHDHDHVVALFRERGRWGAVSKTNHAVLRYRDPVYKTVRELAMSYFHEYFLDDGEKTMRSYSKPFSLARFNKRNWMTDERDLWHIGDALDKSPHFPIAPLSTLKRLRSADKIELKAGDIVEWK